MEIYPCDTPPQNLTIIGHTTKSLWIILSPIIFIVGIVANILAIIVLYRLQRQVASAGVVYRTVLAISDMIILCTGLSRYWIIYLFDCDIRQISDASCKIYLFVIYVSMQYSSWVLVSMTVQRCFVVHNPLRFKHLWTAKVSLIQLSIVFLVLSLVNYHYFHTNGIKDGECGSLTRSIYDYEEKYSVVIDLSLMCVIPFLIMLAGNLYFLKNMRSVREVRRSLTEGQHRKLPRRQNTRLIMKMTWLFLFTTLPISIQMIADSYVEGHAEAMDLAKAVCYLFQYFGVSLNICIYITNDRRFKQQLKMLFNVNKSFSRSFSRNDTTSSQRSTCVSAINETNQFSKMNSIKEVPNATPNPVDANPNPGDVSPKPGDGDRFLSTHM